MSENTTSFNPLNSTSVPDYRSMVVANPDGTYTRLIQQPTVPADPDPNSSSSPVLTKDITIDTSKSTWLRVYIPRHKLLSKSTGKRLPLIVYYHGGGFIFTTADSASNHNFCLMISQHTDSVVVSVEYRCAPEHRLPAAYDDAFEALQCIKTSQDEWLREFADLSNCFLMGSSAGGNIAYQTGLRVCRSGHETLKIKGLVLHHPFFGGLERTGSELKMVNDPVLPLDGNDYMWEVSLPVGSDRDHEYCNPMKGFDSDMCRQVRASDLRVLVLGCNGDPLIDRMVELSKMLKEKGVETVAEFHEGYHGQELMDPFKAHFMFSILNDFIS